MMEEITKEGILKIDKIGLLEYLLDLETVSEPKYPEDLHNYHVIEVLESEKEIHVKFQYKIFGIKKKLSKLKKIKEK